MRGGRQMKSCWRPYPARGHGGMATGMVRWGRAGATATSGTVRSLQDEDDDPGSTDKSIQKQWLAKIN